MRKTSIAIIVLATLLTSGFLVSAHIFRLHIDKTWYQPGEEIIVILEIKNTLNVEKEMDIKVTLVEENNKYPPSAWQYLLILQPGETRNIIIYEETVTEFMVNGEYTLTAQLLEERFVLYEDEVRFSITGLPETMDIDILLSDDPGFSVLKDVFLLNQRIYLSYTSSVENIDVNCKIIYPDNTSKNVTLPYSLVVDQIGLYSLNIDAYKEGYRDIYKSLQFAVVKETPFQSKKGVEIGGETWLYLAVCVIILVAASVAVVLKKMRT